MHNSFSKVFFIKRLSFHLCIKSIEVTISVDDKEDISTRRKHMHFVDLRATNDLDMVTSNPLLSPIQNEIYFITCNN